LQARAVTLDADPSHGLLREPLLKLHHVLRALEFASRDAREVEMPNIEADIGMEAHKAPSVFNFYSPDYAPPGPLGDAGLVSPEAELATTPLLIGFLNGATARGQKCRPGGATCLATTRVSRRLSARKLTETAACDHAQARRRSSSTDCPRATAASAARAPAGGCARRTAARTSRTACWAGSRRTARRPRRSWRSSTCCSRRVG